jgi:HKD family nuclease
MAEFIVQPTGPVRLGDYLDTHLRDQHWNEFRAAVAFVKYSGVQHIERALADFSRRAPVRIAVGVDCQGTSVEGLAALLNAVGDQGQIWICHNENPSTFHPKLYLFKGPRRADVVIGSGNLTAGGLFTNYEASLALSLDLNSGEGQELLRSLENALDAGTNPKNGTARLLDQELLEVLAVRRYIVLEAQEPAEPDPERTQRQRRPEAGRGLFRRVRVQPAPTRPSRRPAVARRELLVPAGARATARGFVMTLQQTDAGFGQTSRGKARRSPEVFIPLGARDYSPQFWGWQDQFQEDPARAGKWDRRGVRVRIGTQTAHVNMMTWPVKHDFRLRSEVLRSAGGVGDILRLEQAVGNPDYDYYAEIVRKNSSEYPYSLSSKIAVL